LRAIAQNCNNLHHHWASRLIYVLPQRAWIAQTTETPTTIRFNRKRQPFYLAFVPFIGPHDEVAQMLQYLI